MKRNLIKYIGSIILGLFLVFVNNGYGQDEKPELLLNLVYNLPVNKVSELVVQTRIKIDRRFENINAAKVHVYMDEVSEANLLGTVITSEKGFGKVNIPVRLQEAWKASDKHKFFAEVEEDPRFVETSAEIEIGKGRLVLGNKSDDEEKIVMVRFEELKNGEWVPVPEQEVKILIKRSMGNILFGEDEAYTTDENGEIEAIFSRENLLGDGKGNITIMARIEDNEQYGDIYAEEILTWGKPLIVQNNFNKRTLFATRDRAPIWLVFLASFIIITVWTAIIYLVWQLLKIIKLGKLKSDEDDTPVLTNVGSIPV